MLSTKKMSTIKKSLAALGLLLAFATVILAAPPDRWIHVSVVSGDGKGETVRINLPLSFAEKVLPTIYAEKFHGGKHGEYRGDKHNENHTVDVKVPLAVVQALLSGKNDEIDLVAGIRALSAQGDVELVTVDDQSEKVRIWTDTRNSSD